MNVIGLNKGLKKTYQHLKKAAQFPVSILLTGETGTGKEVFASLIQKQSERAKGPFIKINCAAIPTDLLEGELFGHKKGAFTGADQDRTGKIELAHNGTLFLDEIGDMSLSLQAKLLRVLQDKQITPLGSNTPIDVDFRLITATNKNLEEAVKKKQFRKDLLYRINSVHRKIPALRERTEDIPDLISFFMNKKSKDFRLPEKRIQDNAIKFLTNYSWPGNIRELENVIERILIGSEDDIIRREDLNFLMDKKEMPEDLNYAYSIISQSVLDKEIEIEDVKNEILDIILNKFDTIAEASKRTGISRDVFYYRKKEKQKI